jgi:signal transduction histidine kinase
MKFINLLILLPFFNYLSAQNSKKDSLYAIIKQNKNDTGTVMALIDYGDLMLNDNADEASKCYENALQKSKECDFWKGEAETYASLAFYYGSRMSDKEKGIKYCHMLLKKSIAQNDELHIGVAYFHYATVYLTSHEFDSSVYYYEKAAPIIERNKPKGLQNIYYNMANIYDDLHLIDKALEYANKCMKIRQVENDTAGIVASYVQLTNIYSWNIEYLSDQITALKDGIRFATLSNNYYALGILYNNLGACKNYDCKQYDSAIYFGLKAIYFAELNGSRINIAKYKTTLADHYASNKQYEMAIQTLNKLNIDSLKTFLTLDKQLSILETRYQCLTGLGKYKDATIISTKMFSLKDSIEAQNSREIALGFDVKLQKANQAKLISEKELKITKQRSMLNIFFVLGIAILVTSTILYLYYRKKQIAQKLKMKTIEKEKELNTIKFNLEGQLQERGRISKEIHDDLGSSLTSISLLTEVLKRRIDTNANPEVNKISATSADMVDKMNEIIWALNTSNDTINSLIAYVRKFSNNFLEDAGIHLQFEEPLIPETMAIEGIVRRNIYLTIKEAINNIVKHAGAANVHLQVNMDNGLHINIQDDGKGIAFDTLPAFRNGLTNMKKRMEDIGGTLNIESTKGTLIKLFYPIKTTA